MNRVCKWSISLTLAILGLAVVPTRRIVQNAQRANAALRTNSKPPGILER